MAYTKEILTLAVEIGDCMLRNGAEIYRVEDTVVHILSSYEVEEFDVYVLSNGIFASANENKEDACSIVRHVPLGAVNLAKISALNQLARDICDQKISLTHGTGLSSAKIFLITKKTHRFSSVDSEVPAFAIFLAEAGLTLFLHLL